MQLGALFDCYEVTIFAFTVIIHTIEDSMAVEVQMLAAVDLYEPVEGAVVVALYVAGELDKQRDMVVDGRFQQTLKTIETLVISIPVVDSDPFGIRIIRPFAFYHRRVDGSGAVGGAGRNSRKRNQ